MKPARFLNILCQARSPVIRVVLAIGLALALFETVSMADENWHSQWRRVCLSSAQEEKAKTDLKTIIDWPGTPTFHADELAKDTKADRFEPLKFDDKKYGIRYGPLCRLQRTKLKEDANPDPKLLRTSTSHICSCAFLSANILITAAHCFFAEDDNWGKPTKVGKATLIRPETGWLLYVVQAYGGETKGKTYVEHLRERAQVLVEWWTPEKFTGNEADLKKNRHADVAFAKVRNEAGNQLQTDRPSYSLRPPKGKAWGDKYSVFDDNILLMHLGYPVAYKNSEVAVQITGQLMRCGKAEESDGGDVAFFGQATKGIKKEKILKSLLASKKKAEGTCPLIVGNMGVGGSGGPLIVRNEDVSDELFWAMFGVVSTCATDTENDPTRRCDAARIEADMVEAVEQISKLKLDFAAPQKVDGVAKAVATADASTEKVELELPKAAARATKKNK